MENYLDQLNEAQKAPVIQKDGAMIVIAGAGSGKTRVLTYRIAYLMQQGVDPFNILSLTFTNKAAREMKERISAIVGTSEAKNLWMGTFHSVFAKILRVEAERLGYPSNFTIYDTQDSQSVIRSLIKDMNLDKDVYKYKQVYSRISSYKNSLITVKAYNNNPELQEADAMARMPQLGALYKNYVERCFKAGAMDFDDLLLKTNELLTRFPEVLAKYQQRFQYILVDEYQDTNHSQYLIVRALSDRFQNICVVGDDAQSIYAFRGANINNILNFQKDYDDVKVYRLEQNYRSTKTIVNAANNVIEQNQNRLDKEVWTHNDLGEKIGVHRSMTDGDEGRFVANMIYDSVMNQHRPYDDFAVLYRTNAQSRSIEDALRKKDIPYRIYGGLSFYQRKEIKDVIAYLRLILNPKDEEALKRVINYPGRGIGDTTISKLVVAADQKGVSLFEILTGLGALDIGINAGIRTKLDNFTTLIQSFQVMNQQYNAFEIAEYVVRHTGLYQEIKKDGTPEGIARLENIEELLNGIKDFVEGQRELADTTGSLAEFLEDVALITDLDQDKEEGQRVSLMTVHLAKGLEFPVVSIVGMEEDLFPSMLSMNSRSELEEERRLFYVALTRAKEKAYLTYAQSRYRWGKLIDAEPSRFIEEIDEKYLDLLTPKPSERYRTFVDPDVFDDHDYSQIRLRGHGTNQSSGQGSKASYSDQGANRVKPAKPQPSAPRFTPPSNLKKLKSLNPDLDKSSAPVDEAALSTLKVGTRVGHMRFGQGTIVALEGQGPDMKAEINFDSAGLKKLLLRFAKLSLVS
ncbi:MAG: ATP-dependent DNA helicase [Flavobacteriaceae bacterium]|nr:ATP-dependent DNA helicase [Flavobacteriaceae bacterium]